MSGLPSLYLVGFMGSGKSEVGRLLAARLGREFVDTDERVEAHEGKTIGAIFADDGEGYFREAEWRALQELDGLGDQVVATGGGLFLGAGQRAFIRRNGRSIWLDITLEAARARVRDGDPRPLWLPGDPVQFRAFYERRRAVYALADLRVDASGGDPESVTGAVLSRIQANFR